MNIRIGLLQLVLGSAVLGAAEPSGPPQEPRLLATTLLPGRVTAALTVFPTGEILAPCEDQILYLLSGEGKILFSWKAPERFFTSAGIFSSVAPTFAVSYLSGRVDVFSFDHSKPAFAPVFSVKHAALPSSSPSWDARGGLNLAWVDGDVQSWSADGRLLWTKRLERPARVLLADEAEGIYAASENSLALLDSTGQSVKSWPFEGVPLGALENAGGSLYVWTSTTVWQRRGLTSFEKIFTGTDLLGVSLDTGERPWILTRKVLVNLDSSFAVVRRIDLPRDAVSPPALDDRGRILFPTKEGLEQWSFDGRFLGFVDQHKESSELSLTAEGVLPLGGEDWRVRIFGSFVTPPFSWSQTGGSASRSFLVRRPLSLKSRLDLGQEPAFQYLYQMAASGEHEKQQEVLSRLETLNAEGKLRAEMPLADLVLLKIARTGLTDLQMDRGRVTNNWPDNRLRAYALLAETASLEDRGELLDLLDKEFDPSSQSQGVLALAQTGWDGDGTLMRMLRTLQSRRPEDPGFANALFDAARRLWLANGRSADPALVPLLMTLYQGNYPRSLRQKAQQFFQELMDAP